MSYLVVVSLVWAFSFGLIGNHLAGLPPAWLGWIRLALSALVFLPFVRRVPWKTALALVATAFLVGACLGMSGLIFQGIFRNPLADPSLVGVMGLVVAAAGLCTIAIDSLVGLCVVIAGLTTTATDSIIVALHDRKSGTN